jgi:bacillolysin
MSKSIKVLALLLAIAGVIGITPILASEPYQSSSGVAQGDDGLRAFNDQTGALNFINFGGNSGLRASNANEATAIISNYARQFGLAAGSQLDLNRTLRTPSGSTYYRYQQTYNGIPVLAGELILAVNRSGAGAAISGEVAQDLRSVATAPQITGAAAAQSALNYVARASGLTASALQTSQPRLAIYDAALLSPFTDPPMLVYEFEVRAPGAPVNYLVLVNADTGGVSLAFNQIDTHWQGEPDTMETQHIDPAPVGGTHFLPNHNATATTYDSNNSTDRQGNGSSTFVCSDTQPAIVSIAGPDSCDGGAASRANAAHLFALQTHDLYDLYFGRNSINDAGMNLISNVDYRRVSGVTYNNAFWDGVQMTYGDGNFWSTDDIVAHELTHGITDYTSDLYYYYESGAINEAMSDIFGEFLDQINGMNSGGGTDLGARWLLGEDLSGFDTSSGSLRDMANPTSRNDPDRMRSPSYYTSSADNGGVHSNSGVANKATYLLVDGDTFNGYTITPLAPNPTDAYILTANIWYEVEYLLTSGSDYGVVYQALDTACTNLIGQTLPGTSEVISSADCVEVNDAALATEMNLEPAYPGFSPEAPIDCDATGAAIVPLYTNDIEGGTGDFSIGSSIFIPLWFASGTFAWEGVQALYGVDYEASTFGQAGIDSWAELDTDVALTGGTEYYLHFWHGWGFEDYLNSDPTIYDGLVVEYSTNGGSSWTDIGSLFEDGKGYDGTIAAGGNPLAGRSAFAYDSHGYVSSRYDLSSLNGQSVRFRWRLGTDSANRDRGYYLDDILVYACQGGNTPTPAPPTDTPIPPTETPVPPTDTPVPPTDTPAPPTETPLPSTLTASAVCNGPDLEVTINQGDGPFDIVASAGINLPMSGLGTGTTIISGPEKWDGVIVFENSGNYEFVELGQFKCRTDERPVPLMPAHRSRTTDAYPMFSWSPISGANNYRIFLFDDAVVAKRTVDIRQNSGGGTQLSLLTPLEPGRLFWRVRGRQNRVWSLWSVRFTLFVDPIVPVAATPIPTIELPVTVTPQPTSGSPVMPTDLPPPPNSR